jgi:SAM-dependent methyltransferase
MGVLKSVARAVFGYERRQQLCRAIRRASHFGFARYCPCCDAYLRRFLPFGHPPRAESLCPSCGSLERHRLVYFYMKHRTNLFDGQPKKLLHVAPEAVLSGLIRAERSIDYLSADLSSPFAMVKMDITDIQYPDNHFDVIYCSHVLEHVPDDRRAMREFLRVLNPGGWAILQVPITAEATFEDPTITSPEDRKRVFGQDDHVRCYGPDYKDRLAEVGFTVKADSFVRDLSDEEIRRLGLVGTGEVYFCTKKLR